MKYDIPEVQDTKIIRLISEDKYRILRHAVLLLGILTIIAFSNQISRYSGTDRLFWMLYVFSSLIAMAYFNMYFLVPRFFFKGRYILYLAFLVLLVVVVQAILSNSLDTLFSHMERLKRSGHETENRKGYYEGTIILISIILVTTMIKLFQRWMRDNARIAELKNLSLTMELGELRNQINPHFLFNMLNGIKALVRTDPEKANIVIMKLSEFLRYQLYENNDERTSLKSEINFLTNFLDLEILRRDNLSVEITSRPEHQTLNNVFLPPNLFTTFVENAVKHSADISGAGSFIRITIEINGDKLLFSCTNSKDPEYTPPSNSKNSGLGLANIKRRLALLYGDNLILDITSTKTVYEINLTILI